MPRIIHKHSEGISYLDWRKGKDNTVEIFDIVVNGPRRTGIGSLLVNKLCSLISEEVRIFAITRSSNEIAQQFYESLRFNTVNPLRRFYSEDEGIDAVMYVRRAGGPK